MPNDLRTGAAFLAYSRRRMNEEYLPRLLACVGEMSDEDLWWRPADNANSAGNLVLHLAGNVNQWINSGLGGRVDDRNRAAEFSEKGPVPRQELVDRITSAVREADETLAKFDPSHIMDVRRIQVYDVSCLDAVSHVVEHFSQHLGQIIYITKLRKRIDLKFYDL
jgi:uncharacterized damage-inducible protein DinB